jgi:hypothetical protein
LNTIVRSTFPPPTSLKKLDDNIRLQHPVALCIPTSCSHSLPSLYNFVDTLKFTCLRLFIIQHYMFRPNRPSSGV